MSAQPPAAPGGEGREQDRLLPVANIQRIMRRLLPADEKISKDAKEVLQESLSEFVCFVTEEAAGRCAELCGNQIYGAFVLNRRVDLHAIDATPARWRGDDGSSALDGASAATSSPRNDLVKKYRVHPTH